MPVQTISNKDNTIPCVFCRTPTVDEINLGPIYAIEDVALHYYCMLFSAALSQNGRDEDGILGFLPADIWKEVRRSNRLRCSHCHGIGASVGCCKKACKQAFHFTCGLKSGVNFRFLGNYEAFCKAHFQPQEIPVEYKNWNCPICISKVKKEDEPVMSGCCRSAVFHKECLKKMALNAGYFFKCPMCNATKTFVQEMRSLGIFVPEQDASWEREPNAFEDLLFQYSNCDAEVCESSKGREYNASKGGFILARCRICGAAGVHRQCGKLKTVANWACGPCKIVEEKTEEERVKSELEMPSTSTNPRRRIVKLPPMSSNLRQVQTKTRLPNGNCEEDIDLSNIRISNSCFAYFPYLQDQMKLFQSDSSPIVPDWRGYVLRTNVVDWLGHYMRKIVGLNVPSPLKMIQTPSKSSENKNLPLVKTSEDNFLTTAPENSAIKSSRKSKKSSKRKFGSRGAKWKRGVIKKKKSSNGKLKADTVNDFLPSSTSEGTSGLVNAQDNNAMVIQTEEEESKSLSVIDQGGVILAKKRKIIELGHEILASGMTKEFYVQSNVEVVGPQADKQDSEIDMESLLPLQVWNENPTKAESELSSESPSLTNGNLKMKPDETAYQDDNYLSIWSDHSYFKRKDLVAPLAPQSENKKVPQTDVGDKLPNSGGESFQSTKGGPKLQDDNLNSSLIIENGDENKSLKRKGCFSVGVIDAINSSKKTKIDHEKLYLGLESQAVKLPL